MGSWKESYLALPAPTNFAPAERTAPEELRLEAEACLTHPVARFLVEALGGLVLILDAHRQVLATSERLIELMAPGSETPLGRRPGELFGCQHAPEGPGGCGTSLACSHCGVVLALLEAQRTGRPVHSECHLSLRRGGFFESAEFEVVASPLQVGPHQLVALVLHDLSATKRREALERLFYHDLTNHMQGIRSLADLLTVKSGASKDIAKKLVHLTDLLYRELRSHQAMTQAEQDQLQPTLGPVLPIEILQDVGDLLTRRPLAKHRRIDILPPPGELIYTDSELLSRIVLNMAMNAVEASAKGETITLSAEIEGPDICFRVHNPGEIAAENRSRIFQRSFSTKGASGRGLGTYAMKLFGENVLRGKVGFDTGPEGTTFWIRLAR
jgi:hypothetical protein